MNIGLSGARPSRGTFLEGSRAPKNQKNGQKLALILTYTGPKAFFLYVRSAQKSIQALSPKSKARRRWGLPDLSASAITFPKQSARVWSLIYLSSVFQWIQGLVRPWKTTIHKQPGRSVYVRSQMCQGEWRKRKITSRCANVCDTVRTT